MEQKLIESALALTNRKIYDDIVTEIVIEGPCKCSEDTHYINYIFSIEKFSYYLLDRQFIIKYYQNQKPGYTPSIETTDLMAGEFGYAIMEYQSGNEEHLIELLTPICKTTNND